MEPKKLFVGESRICKQVAYVVDCETYDLADKVDNVARCRDYEEVVVCAFKRKSKKLIRVKDKSITNVIYLDDVCKRIDNGYYDAIKKKPVALLETSKNETNIPEIDNVITNPENKTTESIDVGKQAVVNDAKQVTKPQREPFFKKTWRRITHPIQTSKKIYLKLRYYVWNEIKWWFIRFYYKWVIRCYYNLKNFCSAVKWWFIRRYYDLKRFGSAVKWWFVRRYDDLKNICNVIKYWFVRYFTTTTKYKEQYYIHKLKNMQPSKLFLYVLHSKPNLNVYCTELETRCDFYYGRDIYGCCSVMLPFGKVKNGNFSAIYNSTYARIIKLSSLNGSYCLCNFNNTCYMNNHPQQINEKKYQNNVYPKKIWISLDKTCNLACKSCRQGHYLYKEQERQEIKMMLKNLLNTGWLEKTDWLILAGQGEVFYSPYYRQLLFTNIKRKQISIFSNGTLFNRQNWDLIKDKYEHIEVSISVDAATSETYQKVRGGNWQALMQNLKMLGELKQQAEIGRFELNFVVQRINFKEMAQFVALGKSINADIINFQKLNYWGHIPYAQFYQKRLIINNRCLDYELYKVLQNPIFKDPIVNLNDFKQLILNSDLEYRERWQNEQTQSLKIDNGK